MIFTGPRVIPGHSQTHLEQFLVLHVAIAGSCTVPKCKAIRKTKDLVLVVYVCAKVITVVSNNFD